MAVAPDPNPTEILGFTVEIDGIVDSSWSSVNIPASSTKHTNNGDIPWGETDFQDLELERRFTDDPFMYNWREAIHDDDVDNGLKNVAIGFIDQDGSELIRWEFDDAWIKHYNIMKFDFSDDGVVTEQVTLAYDSMTRVEP